MILQKKITVLLLFSVVVTLCNGQKTKPEAEIVIDPDTKLPEKYAPFDQWVIVTIPIDSAIKESEIKDNVALFELGKGSSYNDYNAYVSSVAAKKLAFVKTKEKYNKLKVLAPPLRPNSNYAIRIQYAFNSTVNMLHEMNNLINGGASPEQKERQFGRVTKSINDFNLPAIQALKDGIDDFPDDVDWKIVDQQTYESFYSSSLQEDFARFRASFIKSDQLADDIAKFRKDLDTCKVCELLARCNCENLLILNEVESFPKDLGLITCRFASITPDEIIAITKSETSLDSIVSNTAASVGFYRTPKILLANLSKNISFFRSIQKLLTQSTMISLISNNCFHTLINDVNLIIRKLESRHAEATKHYSTITQTLNNAVLNGIGSGNSFRVFLFMQLSTVSSSTTTIKTSAGNYFIPEVGIANMVSGETARGNTYFVRPYIGVNISFRPINKDIRFKDIRTTRYRGPKNSKRLVVSGPTLWHHLSFSLGVTKYSIATNYPEIDDLMKEMCVMTGFNYRLTRAFRIGSGVTWYRRDNPNPLLSDPVTTMPYVSFALDVDVVNWASSITDLFLK